MVSCSQQRGFLEVFFKFNPNASSEMNQFWIDSSICIDGATLKMLLLCVSWFARKLAHRQTDSQTDGHGEYISVFFPMKKALKTFHLIHYSTEWAFACYNESTLDRKVVVETSVLKWIASDLISCKIELFMYSYGG